MKLSIWIFLILLLTQSASGQKQQFFQDSLPVYFDEIKTAEKNNTALWGRDLYGPILLVDPQSREVFANRPDSAGILKPAGNIYSGVLPGNINVANTSVNWSGVTWAMVILPLPQNKQNRINLLAHELFHRAQPSLGFALSNVDNNHLDEKDGRIYLRLELEALKKAVLCSSSKEQLQHLTNAMIFRKYRHIIYEGSDTTENELELNEGVAEFTGVIVSCRNNTQVKSFFETGINDFFSNPTFVRSFAYYTIPVYGYLLYAKNKNWNRKISQQTNLTSYFINAFQIHMPADLKKAVDAIATTYNGNVIIEEETQREEKNKELIASYRLKFIEQPHFEIGFQKMNVSFDPRNIIPIKDQGTIYPNMRITDVWGILTVQNGALMKSDWSGISITNPTRMEGNHISGDGWTLELTADYTVEKDRVNNNYKLVKKSTQEK